MIFPSLFSWIFADVGKVFGGFLQCQLTQNLLPTTAKKIQTCKTEPILLDSNASNQVEKCLNSKESIPRF